MSDDTRPAAPQGSDGSEEQKGATASASLTPASLSGLSPRTRDRLRSGTTLIVLVVLLLVAVGAGFAALTAPFGSDGDAAVAVCRTRTVSDGDTVRPQQVTVSVVNAGGRSGLASRTLDDLEDAGFDRGELANAPEDTDVSGVQIWTSDRRNPAVRLVRGHLGGQVRVRDLDAGVAGVTVVVGNAFAGVKQGRESVVAEESAQVCGP